MISEWSLVNFRQAKCIFSHTIINPLSQYLLISGTQGAHFSFIGEFLHYTIVFDRILVKITLREVLCLFGLCPRVCLYFKNAHSRTCHWVSKGSSASSKHLVVPECCFIHLSPFNPCLGLGKVSWLRLGLGRIKAILGKKIYHTTQNFLENQIKLTEIKQAIVSEWKRNVSD